MRGTIILIICSLIIGLSLCGEESHEETWSYSDISAWSADYCSNNNEEQSPINIPIAASTACSDGTKSLGITLMANSSMVHSINNGHTVQWNGNTGYTTWNDETFSFLQWHFHQPSENFINSVEYQSEVHFVHQNPNNGNLLVLGILFQSTSDASLYGGNVGYRWLQSIEYGVNLSSGGTMEFTQQDVNTSNVLTYELLNTAFKSDMFNFKGSLTTPNCLEGVNWLVSKQVMYMSEDQKDNFARMFPAKYTAVNSDGVAQTIGNNRPTQTLGQRTVMNYCLSTTFEFVSVNYTPEGHSDDNKLVYLWVVVGLLCFAFLAGILCYIFKMEGTKADSAKQDYQTVKPNNSI